jgi:hypothetical protein
MKINEIILLENNDDWGHIKSLFFTNTHFSSPVIYQHSTCTNNCWKLIVWNSILLWHQQKHLIAVKLDMHSELFLTILKRFVLVPHFQLVMNYIKYNENRTMNIRWGTQKQKIHTKIFIIYRHRAPPVHLFSTKRNGRILCNGEKVYVPVWR